MAAPSAAAMVRYRMPFSRTSDGRSHAVCAYARESGRETRKMLQSLGFQAIGLRNEGPHLGHDLGQQRAHLFRRHAGAHAGMIENIEDILVVDVEESLLHVVIEHGPRHLVGVVDGPERLQ